MARSRQEILDDIRRARAEIQNETDCTPEEAVVVHLQEYMEYLIENDPRSNFIYEFVLAAWQGMGETFKVFGSYLERRKANKQKRG